MSEVQKRLEAAGHDIPTPPVPAANYHPFSVSGNTIYVSGQIPVVNGNIARKGHVGAEVNIKDAQTLARMCALNGVTVLQEAAKSVGKTLDDVRVVRISVFVAAAKGFTDNHVVANGASELYHLAFGDDGIHARSAVGVAELPLGVPVEVEAIAEFK